MKLQVSRLLIKSLKIETHRLLRNIFRPYIIIMPEINDDCRFIPQSKARFCPEPSIALHGVVLIKKSNKVKVFSGTALTF